MVNESLSRTPPMSTKASVASSKWSEKLKFVQRKKCSLKEKKVKKVCLKSLSSELCTRKGESSITKPLKCSEQKEKLTQPLQNL